MKINTKNVIVFEWQAILTLLRKHNIWIYVLTNRCIRSYENQFWKKKAFLSKLMIILVLAVFSFGSRLLILQSLVLQWAFFFVILEMTIMSYLRWRIKKWNKGVIWWYIHFNCLFFSPLYNSIFFTSSPSFLPYFTFSFVSHHHTTKFYSLSSSRAFQVRYYSVTLNELMVLLSKG